MIRIDSLSFAYPGHKPLFSMLNLHLNANDCVLLQGENASGKSSLLKLIMGILSAQQGSVQISGKPVRKLDSSLFAHILYHSQKTDENLLGISPQQDWQFWQLAVPSLPALGQVEDKLFSELSSGEKKQHSQRILPFQRDKYWILDEPFAALDSSAAKLLGMELLAKKQLGTGMLVVTHEGNYPPDLFDRVICLAKGQLQELD